MVIIIASSMLSVKPGKASTIAALLNCFHCPMELKFPVLIPTSRSRSVKSDVNTEKSTAVHDECSKKHTVVGI